MLVLMVLLVCFTGERCAWGEDLPGQILGRAERHLAAEDLANALNLLDQARSLAPRDPRVIAFLNRWNLARDKKISAHKRSAEFLLLSRRYDEAAKELLAAEALAPDDGEIREKLATTRQALRLMEKHQESGIWVDPATGRAADPDLYDALSLLRRARDAKNRGDLPLALDLVERVLAREKINAEASNLKSEILEIQHEFELLADLEADTKSGRFFEALQRLDALLRANPASLDLRLRRGNVLLRLGRYAESLRDFEKALEFNATPTPLLPALARVYAGLRRPVETLSILDDPRHPRNGMNTEQYMKTWFSAFPGASAGLFIALMILVGGVVGMFRMLDALIERCPGKVLLGALKTLLLCFVSEPAEQAPAMRAISGKIDHPWLYYCTGLMLIARDELDAAQKYLIPCLDSPTHAARAFFFLGIVRARLGQKMADHDFQKSIIEALNGTPGTWRPGFMVRLEERITQAYRETPGNRSIFADLAHEIITSVP